MELVTPDIGLVFWTAILFAIVLFVLGRFAFKPIANALDSRRTSIKDSLEAADRAKSEMEKLQSDNEELLRQARAERDRMLKDAKTTADKTVAEAQEKAKVEADKIIKDAQESIRSEKNAAMADVRQQVASIALDAAEKVIRRELSDKSSQESLIDEYLDEMKLN